MQKDEKREEKRIKDMLVIFRKRMTWLSALHEGRKKGTAIYKAHYNTEIRPAYDGLKKSITHER